MIPTNDTRAQRARAALDAYASFCHETVGVETIPDLLADLHHYLESRGCPDPVEVIDQELLRAANHYQVEKEESDE
jgi:hypothetical protein